MTLPLPLMCTVW